MANIVTIGGADLPPPPKGPDAHGQAALILAESILHALVESKAITVEGALGIVHSAIDAKEEMGRETREPSDTLERSLELLGGIATSLESDLN